MELNISQSTLLVVDDNKENLKVLGSILKPLGYKLAFAGCGQDALAIIESTNVDLILLDIMMPEMDGYEVCKQLKLHKKNRDIPVIFLTAKNETEDIVLAFDVGGVDYITKPFRKEELLCRIKTHLELKLAKSLLKEQAREYKALGRQAMQTIDHLKDDPYNSIKNEK